MVKLLLDSLLPFYNLSKGKELIITEISTVSQIIKTLRLSGAIQRLDAREIIENIRKMDKNEMSDLIIDLDYDKLKEILKKILAEIALIENFEDRDKNKSIFDFTIYSIKLMREIQKRNELFKMIVEVIHDSQDGYYVSHFHIRIPELLRFNSIKEFCIDSGLIELFIELYERSYNYEIAGINSKIIDMIRDELSKDQINKIIKAFSLERQIYESAMARTLMVDWTIIFQTKLTEESEAILEKYGLGIPDILRL